MDTPFYDVLVVGSGAAGYNAVSRIRQFGQKSVALVTEGVCCGTSRNTGSDKQTYYKLGLGGDSPDSVSRMAQDLFAGGSVDGDNALCEAALSARCFLHLAELGVAFPVNRYGEYVGYKTDHDPFARATSAGPLTSRFMTEALQQEAQRLNVPVLDGLLAVEILKHEERVCGLLCLETATGTLRALPCSAVILATGGPAGIYADSVYPVGHTGSTGLALEAGAAVQNMTEWQYGLASVDPRWNVSGTYMQVLPRFVSVDESGTEREFLADYYDDPYEALSHVFLKGYQWPFDSRKTAGSSVIDLLVYREQVLYRRRVYLDYTRNPFGLTDINFSRLAPEAYDYLAKAGALLSTPLERLAKMNQPAIDLYLSKGRDITKELLEIALCAQHNNGGIAVDLWWQTAVPGLFAVGECAGTHGVARPGGSALNAGQVGSLRAAQYVSYGMTAPAPAGFEAAAEAAINRHRAFCDAVCGNADNAAALLNAARRRMSDCGGALRDTEAMTAALTETQNLLGDLPRLCGVSGKAELTTAYKLRDTLLVQSAALTAMLDFAAAVSGTRGSALYGAMPQDGTLPVCPQESGDSRRQVQEVTLTDGIGAARWRPVRPLPQNDDFFETVWRDYRQNRNIY